MSHLQRKQNENNLLEKKMTAKEFVYRLFFTREDSLDVLQVLFSAVVVVTLIAVWKIISIVLSGPSDVVIEALKTLRWLAGLLVLTAVPSWLVPVIAKMKPLREEKNKLQTPLYNDTGESYDQSTESSS